MSNILTGNIGNAIVATVTIDPAAIGTATTVEETFTVAGVKAGDIVFVNKPTATVGAACVGARASAANTVALTFLNATGATVNPASESYKLLIIRPDGSRTDANM